MPRVSRRILKLRKSLRRPLTFTERSDVASSRGCIEARSRSSSPIARFPSNPKSGGRSFTRVGELASPFASTSSASARLPRGHPELRREEAGNQETDLERPAYKLSSIFCVLCAFCGSPLPDLRPLIRRKEHFVPFLDGKRLIELRDVAKRTIRAIHVGRVRIGQDLLP